jgi:hypothetical protein
MYQFFARRVNKLFFLKNKLTLLLKLERTYLKLHLTVCLSVIIIYLLVNWFTVRKENEEMEA